MAWVINITKHTTTTACGILRSEDAGPADGARAGTNGYPFRALLMQSRDTAPGRSRLVPADLLHILRPDRGAIDLAPVGVSDPDAGIAVAQIVAPDEQVACHLVGHHECRFGAFEHHAARIDLHDIADHKIKEKTAHATLQLGAAHARPCRLQSAFDLKFSRARSRHFAAPDVTGRGAISST